MCNTVPFVLQKGSHNVEVLDPLSANILDLDVISDHYQPSAPTIVDYIWGFFTGNYTIDYISIIQDRLDVFYVFLHILSTYNIYYSI